MKVEKENIRELTVEEIGSVAGGSTPVCITVGAAVLYWWVFIK